MSGLNGNNPPNPLNGPKRVLVVGANSYIGGSFARYAGGRLCIDIVDSYEGWKAATFHKYDSVLMVAGLAHLKWNRKQQEANKDRYFAVNCDLAVAVAEKARAGGAGQFIYLSSMAVYGLAEGEITADTIALPRARDYYGQSKHRAEMALTSLFGAGTAKTEDAQSVVPVDCSSVDTASLCIVRPPMVYGPGCPGKFATLVKIAKKLPLIPNINNRRSMIYADNLSEFLCLAVEKNISGVFAPHNKEYMNTTWLLKAARKAIGKRTWVVPGFSLVVRCLKPFVTALKTAFGSLYYDEEMCMLPSGDNYQPVSAEESILRSLKG